MSFGNSLSITKRQKQTIVRRNLPPAPRKIFSPVQVAEPRDVDTPYEIALRERAGRLAANRRIIAGRDWYNQVRKSYGKAR